MVTDQEVASFLQNEKAKLTLIHPSASDETLINLLLNKLAERVLFAEFELSDAFDLPSTIGPAPGEAKRIMQNLRAIVNKHYISPEEMSRPHLDCGDSACLSPTRSRGGMRTNGGCRCANEDLAREHEKLAHKLRSKPHYK